MIIDITYDSSVATCPDESAFKACVAGVVKFYEGEFNNPITINIDVGWGEVDGQAMGPNSLGESITTYSGPFAYSQVRAALVQAPRSPGTIEGDANLPAADPTGGQKFQLATAEAAALGLISSQPAVDGYLGIGSGFHWDYQTGNSTAAVPSSEFDLFSILAHEISEDMGRFSGLQDFPGQNILTALDLFDYTAKGAMMVGGAQSTPHYFSLDGGATDLKDYNTVSGGDWADWYGNGREGLGDGPWDSYDAFSPPGVAAPVSVTDLELMNVLGYNPFPPSFAATHLTLSVTSISAFIAVYSDFYGAGASHTGFFLSTSSTVTTSDTLVGKIATPSLAEGAQTKVSGALSLPSGLATGTYYLAAIADYDGAVSQTVRPVDVSNVLQVSIVNQGSVGTLSGVKGVTAINDGALSLASPLDLEGSLATTGALTVSSTVSGGGTLELPATTSFAPGTALTVAHVAEYTGDTAAFHESLAYAGQLAQSGGTLTVDSGDQLSLSGSGSLISGTLAGAGTVAFTGGTVTFGNATLKAGKVEIAGANATFTGSTTYSALSIASRALLDGTLTIGGGRAFSVVAGGDLIVAPTGNLVLAGPLTLAGTLTLDRNYDLATTVSGTGTISLIGGVTTFGAGVDLGVARINEGAGTKAEVSTASLVYGGLLDQAKGGALGVTAGDKLTLGGVGDMISGTLAGPGTIAFTAGSDYFSGATFAGPITINGAGTVFNGQDATTRSLTIDSASTVNGTLSVAGSLILGAPLKGGGSLTLENGTLTARAGAALGVKVVNEEFGGLLQVEETSLAYNGLLNAFGGALSVSGGDTLTLTGSGDTLANALIGAGTIVLAAGSDTVSNATIALGKLEIDGASTTFSGFTTLSGGLEVATAATLGGTIAASGAHATLSGPGILTLGGIITAAASGATLTSSGTIEGAGTIGGGGLTFVNAAAGLLEATASGGLTLGASGSTFVNAGTIESAADAITIVGTLANSGILVSNSGMTVEGPVTGTGKVEIAHGGSAYFSGAFGENVVFTGDSSTLGLAQAYAGTISGFPTDGSSGVDLGFLPFFQGTMTTSYSGSSTAGVLTISNGSQTATLHFSGNYLSAAFVAIDDGGGNTFVFSPTGGGAIRLASAMASFAPERSAHAQPDMVSPTPDLFRPLASPHAALA